MSQPLRFSQPTSWMPQMLRQKRLRTDLLLRRGDSHRSGGIGTDVPIAGGDTLGQIVSGGEGTPQFLK